MDDLAKKKAQRYLYLKRLYDLADGDTFPIFGFAEIGNQLGWDEVTTDKVINYLRDEGLIRFVTFGTVSITHAGVKQIENAADHPDQPTRYFPASSLIIISASGDITIGGDVIGQNKKTNASE